MDFVQRAKALMKATAKSGAVKILPLAAAVAMSMGTANAAASFSANAIGLCQQGEQNGSLGITDLGTVGGVTGLKIFNPSGGSCFASGEGIAVLNTGMVGSSGGTFDANLEQLLVSFEFTGTMLINSEVSADYTWNLTLSINGGDAFASTGDLVASDGELVTSANVGPLVVDMTGVAGQTFTDWSLFLQMTGPPDEGSTPFFIAVSIPENSIDINAVNPTVGDVPEPGTIGLMIAGGVALLIRRRMV